MTSLRLPIAVKLGAGFGTVLVLAALIAGGALTRMGTMDHRALHLGTNSLPSAEAIDAISLAEARTRSNQFAVGLVSLQPTQRRRSQARVAKFAAETQAGFSAYRRLLTDGRDRVLFAKAQADWNAYLQATAQVAALSRAGRRDEIAAILTGVGHDRFDASQTTLQSWVAYNGRLAQASIDGASSSYRSGRFLVLALLLVAMLVGIASATLLTRSIRNNVRNVISCLTKLRDHCTTELRAGLGRVAEGDFTYDVQAVTPPIERFSADEIGDVARAVNAVRENTVASVEAYNSSRAALGSIIGQVAGTATLVAAGSQEVALASSESGRAVEEIAHAIGGGTNVDGAAMHADHTALAAVEAQKAAAEGRELVGRVSDAIAATQSSSRDAVAAMEKLGAQSDEIGGIVVTISGIAEQTNLLALNAAIEAARAGDQGRGFAVVADEVRKLAEESQRAASTIGTLIGQIQRDTTSTIAAVQHGAEQTDASTTTVTETESAFVRIDDAINDVHRRVTMIASTLEEVSASTEQTSASTEEISATAQSLADSAQSLQQLTARFVVAA